MTREPIATSLGRLAPLQEDADAIHWVPASHERVRVKATARGYGYEYELIVSGGAYLIRRQYWRHGKVVESVETTPAPIGSQSRTEALWADLVNGRAI